MIFFRTFKYLRYILLARHRIGHGIHSPFVYDLVSRVFRNKTDEKIVSEIERIRKKMLSDHRSVVVTDYGSGSVKGITNTKKVSAIAKKSSVSKKYGIFLSGMAAEFSGTEVIELGTSLGISTMYLASGCNEAAVRTMEGCQSLSQLARENFIEAGLTNITVTTGRFEEVLPGILSLKKSPGLVFIDGDHRKKPLVSYFSRISEVSDSKTVIIIDDIYHSREMAEAWEEIKSFRKVTVTIDIFRMGIVFFRQGINRQDFIIRY
jgi:predicted O-methyltransferase YrrM